MAENYVVSMTVKLESLNLDKCGISCHELNSGSDVAKEAGTYSKTSCSLHYHHLIIYLFQISKSASIILLKNDFSIPVAIELGHPVFDNLKKVILYLMPVRNEPLYKLSIHTKNISKPERIPSSLRLRTISLMYEQPESGNSLINFSTIQIQSRYQMLLSNKVLKTHKSCKRIGVFSKSIW